MLPLAKARSGGLQPYYCRGTWTYFCMPQAQKAGNHKSCSCPCVAGTSEDPSGAKRQPAKPAPLHPFPACRQGELLSSAKMSQVTISKRYINHLQHLPPQGTAKEDENGARNRPRRAGRRWSRAGRQDQQNSHCPNTASNHRSTRIAPCSPGASLSSSSSPPPHSLPSFLTNCIQAKLMKAKSFSSCSWDFRIQLKVLWSRLQTHLQCSGIFALIILICFILLCFL